jgi:hypothetical protein
MKYKFDLTTVYDWRAGGEESKGKEKGTNAGRICMLLMSRTSLTRLIVVDRPNSCINSLVKAHYAINECR